MIIFIISVVVAFDGDDAVVDETAGRCFCRRYWLLMLCFGWMMMIINNKYNKKKGEEW